MEEMHPGRAGICRDREEKNVMKGKGFTLIELVVSFTVLTFAVASILALFPLGIKISDNTAWMTNAGNLAQQRLEEIRRGEKDIWEENAPALPAYPVRRWYRSWGPGILPWSPVSLTGEYVDEQDPWDLIPVWNFPPRPFGAASKTGDVHNDVGCEKYSWLMSVEKIPGSVTGDFRDNLRKVTVYIFITDSKGSSPLLDDPGTPMIDEGAGYRQREFIFYIAR